MENDFIQFTVGARKVYFRQWPSMPVVAVEIVDYTGKNPPEDVNALAIPLELSQLRYLQAFLNATIIELEGKK